MKRGAMQRVQIEGLLRVWQQIVGTSGLVLRSSYALDAAGLPVPPVQFNIVELRSPPPVWLEPVIRRWTATGYDVSAPHSNIAPAIARMRGASFPRHAWRWLARQLKRAAG